MEHFCAVIRGEKTRKEYAHILNRHRAAISIQKHVKARILRKKFERLNGASTALQSGNTYVYCSTTKMKIIVKHYQLFLHILKFCKHLYLVSFPLSREKNVLVFLAFFQKIYITVLPEHQLSWTALTNRKTTSIKNVTQNISRHISSKTSKYIIIMNSC